MKPSKCIFLLLGAAILALAGSCGRSEAERVQTAYDLAWQNPDSAYIIISSINPHDLSSPKERAQYLLTKALTNAGRGQSLYTDSLLQEASNYFATSGDTTAMVVAARLNATHLWERGKKAEAYTTIKSALKFLGSRNVMMQSELHFSLLELAHEDGDFARVIVELDWLSAHASDSRHRFEIACRKMAALYLLNHTDRAIALGDSIRQSDIMPPIKSHGSQQFLSDYATILDDAGRSRDAIEVLAGVIANRDSIQPDEQLGYSILLTRFHINCGNYAEASRYMSMIDSINISNIDFEAQNNILLMRNAIHLHRTGRLASQQNFALSKSFIDDLRHTRSQRNVAIQSASDLERRNIELTVERQRLWIVILAIASLCLAASSVVFYMLRRRKRHLVETQERIETLTEMLNTLPDADNEKSDRVKQLVLQRIGMIKEFAESPTSQNQDALRRIANIGNQGEQIDALVSWPEFYKMIDELYDNFHSNILANFADTLSEKEIQIICLMKSGFSTKEIGVLTQQSSATIYVRKTSIRKKLHSPENGDIIAEIDHHFSIGTEH